jgi:prepilin-type N-terminal cleavage/methylation domain-containing protein
VKALRKCGFTLLEMLIAISILSMIFATCHLAFSGSINAWRRGSEYLDRQHHSDFAFERISAALRSASFMQNDELDYGLYHTDNELDGQPADELSWITASPAFVRTPYSLAPHRLLLTITSEIENTPALAAKAYFPFDQEEQIELTEYRTVSRSLIGFNCRFYNTLDEEWVDEWTTSNSIPSEIEITLYTPPIDENDEPVTFTRILNIPVSEQQTSSDSKKAKTQ